MPRVAKRKIRETWREALADRAGPDATEFLARFDRLRADGVEEAEAAYRILEAAGRLWVVDEPAAERPTVAPEDEVPAV